MPRHFAAISVDELRAKVEAVMGDEGLHPLLDSLGKDIKVSFDLENVSYGPRDGFGPMPLMGCRSDPSGLTYWGFAAGGDWEHPVFFIVYWDGKRLRGYVPTEGNPWNTSTHCAYGNDDKKDLANARKRWPDALKDAESVDPGDFDFNSDAIHADIMARVLPKPS